MELLVVLGVISIVFLLNQWIHYKEREALLDRCMARDLPELATFQIERRKAEIPDKIKRAEDDFERL